MYSNTFSPAQEKAHPIFNMQNLMLLFSAFFIFTLFFHPGNLFGGSGENEGSSSVNSQPSSALPPSMATAAALPPPADISQLVTDALAFYNSLNSTQQAALQLTYSTTLARKWSNLPCGSSCRNGVQFGNLSAAQLELAYTVIGDILGTGTNNGSDEFKSITIAEDYLGSVGNSSQYNSGLRWIAFLNTPSETGAWMLQFGGHHYAANIAFNNGHVIGTTPMFVALEPSTFTYNGTAYGPMEDERDALRAMLASLSTAELTTAKLSTTFSDCLMSPGESNGNSNTFPATKQGIAVNTLTQSQKDLVLAAIQNYTDDMDATTAAAVLARYTDEIDETYIAYTGSGTSGNTTSFLVSNSNYVRIDGPSVWIEFACQNGVVIQGQIHYHSVWRDHLHDYGLDLSGDAIDDYNTAVRDVQAAINLNIYPNPAHGQINTRFSQEVKDARVTVTDMAGKVVYRGKLSGQELSLQLHDLSKGSYTLNVQDDMNLYAGKFILN
ncbi:MAG: DUF3500 domain-containing protein [Bacteroidetes bacterium]|nr:DUF3500 domain-containing protein [Bacteroidota bacterium]